VKVRVMDAAGNQRTQDYSFTLDSTAPTAAVLTLVCDSGSQAGDQLTNNGALNVVAEAGATLEYSTNASSTDPTWSSTFAAADGANTVSVRVTDKAGNVSSTSSLSFTLDKTAPVAASVSLVCDSGLTAVANNDKISHTGTLAVQTAETAGLIEYSTDGLSWAATLAAAEGVNNVKVRVTDAAGNLGAVTDYAFTLDTQAPAAPVLGLVCDSGLLGSDKITQNGAFSATTSEVGATLQYSTDGVAWSNTFVAAEGSNTVKARVLDAAGNAGAASTLSFTLDTLISKPSVALSCDSGASSSDKITRSGALSLNNVDSDAQVQYSTDGQTWTSSFTAVEGSNSVSVKVTDAAGNVATSDTLVFQLRTLDAVFTLKLDNTSNSGSQTDLVTNDVTPTISGTGTTGDIIQVTMPGTGEVLSTTVAADGTWSVTPTMDVASGSVSVTATNAAGVVSAPKTLPLVMDTAVATPTVALVCDSGTSSSDKISRDGSLVVGNLEAGSTVEYSTNGSMWGTTFAATEGSNTVQVRQTDTAGNVSASSSLSFTLDTTAPTPAVSINAIGGDDALSPADAVQTQTGITGSVTNAREGDLVKVLVNGQTFSATVDALGNYSVSVATADLIADQGSEIEVVLMASDAAGNTHMVSDTRTYKVDITVPTVQSIVLDKSALKVGETATVTITFSEKVKAFDLSDLTADNGTLTGLATADSGLTWTATLTPTASIEDTTNVVKVLANYTDLSDNLGTAATSGNYSVETLAPTATLQLADEALKAGETTTLTITFSEKVSNFSNTDVTVANGSLGTLSSTDGIVWTGTFTPSVNLEDATNVITLANTYTDVAGNAGQSADSGNYSVDTKAPTASVTLTDNTNAAITSLTAGQSAKVTITFSEAVKDFSNADVTAPNGTLSTLASTDGGTTWTATFTPSANVEVAANSISVNPAAYSDLADNAGSAASSATYAVDTQGPTASISISDSALTAGETAQVTISFSEKVTGFDNT
ncbi:Ig-like domain-containing protein, partial [Limnohabitans sp. WS1]|uniref:Ig-like domain-containing protein n=1 Tax=Limnohabitans sp. WS1 TaxID=1100726 RepID=UPI000DD233CC